MMQSDTVYGLLTHQRVTDTKRDRARALRQHMTASERMLWERLRKRQFQGHRFRRQQIIDGFIVVFIATTLAWSLSLMEPPIAPARTMMPSAILSLQDVDYVSCV